jgi:hypothetical protein
MRLFIGTTDGTALSPQALSNVEVFVASDLSDTLGAWTRLPSGALVLTNGYLRLEDPGSAGVPRRFYIAVENP